VTDVTPIPTNHPPTLPPRVHPVRYPDDPTRVSIVVDFVTVIEVAPDEMHMALRVATATMERMDYVIAHREGLLRGADIPISTPPA